MKLKLPTKNRTIIGKIFSLVIHDLYHYDEGFSNIVLNNSGFFAAESFFHKILDKSWTLL